MATRFALTFSCADRIGIVHAVTGFLQAEGCNITDSAQFNEAESGRFFMRVAFDGPDDAAVEALRKAFAETGTAYAMDWSLHDMARPVRTLVLVSRFDHCLRDLLYRRGMGELPVEVVAVVSNHGEAADLTAQHGVPFHHLPVTAATKAAQEAALERLIAEHDAELIVLARYMQVLSGDLCSRLEGRVINIHHSFLPGFKGAKPYHQAHARGVKLIGASAHFATPDLDEGPIIDQGVVPVTHAYSPDELVTLGRDIERVVLARAVRAYAERRILVNGARTVVFGK